MGCGLANITFLYISAYFTQFPAKKSFELDPNPHPNRGGGWQTLVSVQIWIFHLTPSNNKTILLTPTHAPGPKGRGMTNIYFCADLYVSFNS